MYRKEIRGREEGRNEVNTEFKDSSGGGETF
jgi:hypothetical protein